MYDLQYIFNLVYRIQQTMVRINNISINGEVDNPPEVRQISHTTL